LAVGEYIEKFDHAMALNSNDPLLPALRQVHPESIIEFKDTDPTTEVIAKDLFDHIEEVLKSGFVGESNAGTTYRIEPAAVTLERVRVWETPSSWAEFSR
jgi:6-pyruvoyltetrahydropterin/6-carboxytetrahydropterin synthase